METRHDHVQEPERIRPATLSGADSPPEAPHLAASFSRTQPHGIITQFPGLDTLGQVVATLPQVPSLREGVESPGVDILR